MVTDTTAERLAHDLIATREMLHIALALLAEAQKQLDARDRIVIALRQDLSRLMQVQA